MARHPSTVVSTISFIILFYLFIYGHQYSASSPQDPAPPPTLESGKEAVFEITDDKPILTGFGHVQRCRFGSISDGPVNFSVSSDIDTWSLRIVDFLTNPLKEFSNKHSQSELTFSLHLDAGETFYLDLIRPTSSDSGVIKLTLVEVNHDVGKKTIKDAIRKAYSLLLQSENAKSSNDFDRAVKYTQESFSIMIAYSGFKQNKEAIDFIREKVGLSAYNMRDYDTVINAWNLAEQYYSQVLPFTDKKLTSIRMDLGAVLFSQKKYEEAASQLNKVVKVFEITLPADDQLLQKARMNLGISLRKLGKINEAYKYLEQVISVYEQTLPSDDLEFQKAKHNHAIVLMYKGQHAQARDILLKVISIMEMKLPDDDLTLQEARLNLASTIRVLGDFYTSRKLVEDVLEVYKSKLPDEHPSVLSALYELAVIEENQGNIHISRTILEKILDIQGERLKHDHSTFLMTKMAYASNLASFGDLYGALASYEEVLEAYERIYPDDHQNLQRVRTNYAQTLYELGDFDQSRMYLLKAIDIYEKTHPLDHPLLQFARLNLSMTLLGLEKYDEAISLIDSVLNSFKDNKDIDPNLIQVARNNLAVVHWHLGEFDKSRNILIKIVDTYKQLYAFSNESMLLAKANLAVLNECLGRHDESKSQIQDTINEVVSVISNMIKTGSIREVDQAVNNFRWILNHYLSLGMNNKFNASDSFLISETFKAVGSRAGKYHKIIVSKGGETFQRQLDDFRIANDAIAETSIDDLPEVINKRDKTKRALLQAVSQIPDINNINVIKTVNDITKAYPENWIGVSYQYYDKFKYTGDSNDPIKIIPSYVAFILHSSGKVNRIELESAKSIDTSVRNWLSQLINIKNGYYLQKEFHEGGMYLRSMIWDPIIDKIGCMEKIIISPDSLLCTVPFEALPDGNGFLLDKFTFAYTDSLSSLNILNGSKYDKFHSFLAMGNIDYNANPKMVDSDNNSIPENLINADQSISNIVQRTVPIWIDRRRVNPIPGTEKEIRSLAHLYKNVFDENAILIEGAYASKSSFLALCSYANYLHIATHGYSASEIVKSTNTSRTTDRSIIINIDNKISGLAPSLLCGIRFAGSNVSDKNQMDYGVITAEEIMGLDLSRCKLAVLSACKTNVGLLRHGQGIMSLQRSLNIAGANGSVTSLWDVDDYATWLLFEKFYDFLWKDDLTPVEALRKAKLHLRNLTLKEIHATISEHPSFEQRGLSLSRMESKYINKYNPYALPFYWASFVYWGNVN